LIVTLAAAYGHTLRSPFVFDDFVNIVDNTFLRIQNLSLDSIAYVWQGADSGAHRKLAYLTFALNYLWGGYNPVGYHLVNITIHIACGFLAALFFSQTLKTEWLADRYHRVRPWLAWGAAFLWALHPLQITSVTYIVQRMTSFAVFFALLAMIGWMAGRKSWKQNCYTRAIFYWASGGAAWIIGLYFKEHVIVVPGLIIIHEFFLIRRGHFRLKLRWIMIGAAVSAGIMFFYLGPEPWNSISEGYARRNFSQIERVMTESRVLWHYVSLFYFPVADRFTLLYDYSISRNLFSPVTTIFSILSWTVVIAVTWIYRRRWPVFSWMAAWYLAGHLIESTVFPLEIIFEHRMYLPSLCLAQGSVLLFFDILSKRANRPKLQVVILVIVLLTVGGSTYTRNMDFKDAVTFNHAELNKYPKSKRIRLNLSVALFRSGNILEGGRLLEEIAKENPTDIEVQQNWLNFLVLYRKDSPAAESVYQRIIKLLNKDNYNSHNDARALFNLARLCQRVGNHKRTLFLIDYLLNDFDNGALWYVKARSHAELKDLDSAAQAFYQAWRKNSKDPYTLYWYGKTLIQIGKYDKGCMMLKKAAQNSVDAQTALLSRELLRRICLTDKNL